MVIVYLYLQPKLFKRYSNLLQQIPKNSDKLRKGKSVLPKQNANIPKITTDSGGSLVSLINIG